MSPVNNVNNVNSVNNAHNVNDAHDETDLRSLGRAVGTGVASLASRTVALQLVVLGGMVALTRLLDPRDFGVFAILRAALELFSIFANTGVGGALIRQREEPSERQLSSLFYFQMAVVTALMVAVVALAGLLSRLWPGLPASAPLLIRVLAIDAVLVSARINPMLQMERRLGFGSLATIDVAGSIVFYGTAVSLAAAGLGIWALVVGVVAQGALITLLAFAISPWRPRLQFSWDALRPLLRFGLAQQTRHVIGFANGAVTPFWGGRALGPAAVGYVNWAQATAYFCLNVVEILARVGFPLFARLQHDRALIGESLGRMIQLSACATFAWVSLCLGLGEHLTVIVFSDKWLPAVPMLMVFALAISIGFLSPLVAVALDAIGRPGLFARIALGWTLLNWIVAPMAAARWQTLGFTIGYAVHVVVGNLVIAFVVLRVFPEATLWRRLRAPLLAGILAAAVGRLLLAPLVAGPFSFALSAAVVLGLFAGIVWAVDGPAFLRALSVVPGITDGKGPAVLAPVIP